MRGAAALRTLDLEPPSMPRQAILCIRAMRDPLPGAVDLRSSHAPRPDRWERAARAEVASIMRRAVRPALGAVPASAEAVLFADASEMLACAARAAAEGTLASQWWWEHLVIPRTSQGVANKWLRSPAYVPAAIEILARERRLTSIVAALTSSQALQVLQAVLRVFKLEPFSAALADTFDQAQHETAAAQQSRAAVVPPWREVVAESETHSLALEHRTLAGVALVLLRRPSIARSESFARQTLASIVATLHVDRERHPSMPHPADAVPRPQRPWQIGIERARGGAPRTIAGARTAAAPVERNRSLPPRPRRTNRRSSPVPRDVAPPLPQSGHVAQRRVEQLDVCASAGTPPADSNERPAPRLEVGRGSRPIETERVLPLVPDLVIQSDCAGLFFLLNLFIAMELYSDFTSPAQRGLPYNIWHFLCRVARALTGEGLEDDPVWPFLETLAGDDEDTIDDDALAPLLERIREALSVFESPAFLIRRFARITTSPAHVDVYFSLPAHPIEIRMSGLDRDPGWIPAAARHVTFHFD